MRKMMNRRWILFVLMAFTLGINTNVKAQEANPTECVVGSEVTVTSPILVTGGIASVNFTVAEGCELTVMLASYQIPEGEEQFPQNRFARSGRLFDAGEYLLRVNVPECSYHVDLVKAEAVKTLEVEGQYSNLLVATYGGANTACNNEEDPQSVCPLGRDAVIIEGDRGDGDSFAIEGNTATASFKIAEGCTDISVTVLAFQRTTEERLPQTLEDSASGNFSYDDGATHTLSVEIPPCQMQADLLYGTFVGTELNESNINEFSTRALDWITNLTVCEEVTPPPPPTPTPTPNPPPPAPQPPPSGGGSSTPPALITVNKVVINDNGGTAVAADFTLRVGNNVVTNGVQTSFSAGGPYTISETGPTGYTATFSGSCDDQGLMTVSSGLTYICTITNNDIAQGIVLGETLPPPDMGGVLEENTTPIGGVAAGLTIPLTIIMGLLLIAAGITGLYISKQGQLDV